MLALEILVETVFFPHDDLVTVRLKSRTQPLHGYSLDATNNYTAINVELSQPYTRFKRRE